MLKELWKQFSISESRQKKIIIFNIFLFSLIPIANLSTLAVVVLAFLDIFTELEISDIVFYSFLFLAILSWTLFLFFAFKALKNLTK